MEKLGGRLWSYRMLDIDLLRGMRLQRSLEVTNGPTIAVFRSFRLGEITYGKTLWRRRVRLGVPTWAYGKRFLRKCLRSR